MRNENFIQLTSEKNKKHEIAQTEQIKQIKQLYDVQFAVNCIKNVYELISYIEFAYGDS